MYAGFRQEILERGDYLNEVGISYRDRINLIQYMKDWEALVNTVLNFWVP